MSNGPARIPVIAAVAGLVVLLLAAPVAWAHSDSENGPPVMTARAALEKGDVTPVLKWVPADHEKEVRDAFAKALIVRAKGPEAKALADRWFCELVVRLFRAEGGEPFRGLSPAGGAQPPVVVAAQQALADGKADDLIRDLSDEMAKGVRDRFARVRETAKHANDSVEDGRAYVAALVDFMHHVQDVHNLITVAPATHTHDADAARPAAAAGADDGLLPAALGKAGWKAEMRKLKVATPEGDAVKEIACAANSVGMQFVRVPAGEFAMGDALTPAAAAEKWPGGKAEWFVNAHPRHHVRITRAFWLGATQITRGQFARFVRETSYKTDAEQIGKAFAPKDGKWEMRDAVSWRNPLFEQTDDHPVVCVSWNDAKAFCAWLSKKESLTYRLPTEAEWEYAARAGSDSAWYWGDEASGAQGRASIAGEGEATGWDVLFKGVRDGYSYTAPAGAFTPNAFGLHDMIGNTWQWCEDRYGAEYYKESPADDPAGPATGVLRILRGGSWSRGPGLARSSVRHGAPPSRRQADDGFRVVLCVVEQ